jgi:predicted dehydrogenase
MPEKIQTIIVGMGGVSHRMLDVLHQRSWHEVVAVVDVREDALKQAQVDLSLPESALFNDLQSALDLVSADMVMINTPSELHYEQTKATLKAGLTPLVAKPFTNNFDHAVELVSLADELNIKLCIAQQMRFFRHYLSVSEFVQAGHLGKVEQIYFLNAKPRHRALNLVGFEHPVLYEMTCHHLDCLFSIFPDIIPESITCDGYQPSWSVYDSPCMINALIRFNEGVHMLYHAGYSSQSDSYELRLEGTKGVLRCRGIHMSNNTMAYEFAERGANFQPINLDYGRPSTQPWELFFDKWYDYITGGSEPSFSGRNNLKILAIITAAMESIDSESFVKVATHPRYQPLFGRPL